MASLLQAAFRRRTTGDDESARAVVTADGPAGDLVFPSGGDGVWQISTVQGRACLGPDEKSHYVYVVVPPELRRRAHGRTLWLEVEYFGASYGRFRVQYASTDRGAPHEGLYRPADQR